MTTKELEVFTIKELPQKVRDKVLDRYRESMDFDYDWIWEAFMERADAKGIIINKKSLSFDLYRDDIDFEYSIDMDKIADEYFPDRQLVLTLAYDEDDEEYLEMHNQLREDCEEEALTITSQMKKELLHELKEAYEYDTSEESLMEWLDDALFLEDGHRVD